MATSAQVRRTAVRTTEEAVTRTPDRWPDPARDRAHDRAQGRAHDRTPASRTHPPRRHRLRRTHPALRIEYERASCVLWLPDPDEPPVLTGFGDAAALAFAACLELPVEREALVLLDERRAVTAMLLDPPPEVGVGIGWCDGPGLEVPFCHTLDIVVVDRVAGGPPSDHELHGFHALRRLHVLQGLLLLDVVQVDGDRVRSLAIAAGSACAWFDEPAA